jgi:hypothetical protein
LYLVPANEDTQRVIARTTLALLLVTATAVGAVALIDQRRNQTCFALGRNNATLIKPCRRRPPDALRNAIVLFVAGVAGSVAILTRRTLIALAIFTAICSAGLAVALIEYAMHTESSSVGPTAAALDEGFAFVFGIGAGVMLGSLVGSLVGSFAGKVAEEQRLMRGWVIGMSGYGLLVLFDILFGAIDVGLVGYLLVAVPVAVGAAIGAAAGTALRVAFRAVRGDIVA